MIPNQFITVDEITNYGRVLIVEKKKDTMTQISSILGKVYSVFFLPLEANIHGPREKISNTETLPEVNGSLYQFLSSNLSDTLILGDLTV